MPPIAALSNENGPKPTVSPPLPPRCTSSTVSAPRPREKLPATRPLAAAFFSPSGASKCTILRKAPCAGLTGPKDGGDRASAALVRIRTALLSADGAARKRLMCSCACIRCRILARRDGGTKGRVGEWLWACEFVARLRVRAQWLVCKCVCRCVPAISVCRAANSCGKGQQQVQSLYQQAS